MLRLRAQSVSTLDVAVVCGVYGKLENISLVADPAKNSVLIMKDSEICKNTIQQ